MEGEKASSVVVTGGKGGEGGRMKLLLLLAWGTVVAAGLEERKGLRRILDGGDSGITGCTEMVVEGLASEDLIEGPMTFSANRFSSNAKSADAVK